MQTTGKVESKRVESSLCNYASNASADHLGEALKGTNAGSAASD